MSNSLSDEVVSNLENFIATSDFSELYKEYGWGEDMWALGFPKILDLEKKLGTTYKKGEFQRDHILSVAKWGRLRNIKRVTCPEVFAISDSDDTLALLNLLKNNIKGMGPTYLSKVLRFSYPKLYGAIDTRIVRVFGNGDESAKRHSWLKVKVRNDGYGWYIPEYQSVWPSEYGTWVEILQFISKRLNEEEISCPHPKAFVDSGLRDMGQWTSADVEMALFSYASGSLEK